MSTEILNNNLKTKEKKNHINKIDISELKRKIILQKKKEKFHKNIVLATICVGVTAIGYFVI